MNDFESLAHKITGCKKFAGSGDVLNSLSAEAVLSKKEGIETVVAEVHAISAAPTGPSDTCHAPLCGAGQSHAF